MDPAVTTLLTVGHGAAEWPAFLDELHAAQVDSVVDVRIAPGSRRHPHFGRDELAAHLAEAGIDYRWERRLGGFRRASAGSPDTALRNASFRGYAAYMRGPEFGAALAQVLESAAKERTAVMCSETVWWRCHRRLIADHAVLVEGADVRHVMPGGVLRPHIVTAAARVTPRGLVYDVE